MRWQKSKKYNGSGEKKKNKKEDGDDEDEGRHMKQTGMKGGIRRENIRAEKDKN